MSLLNTAHLSVYPPVTTGGVTVESGASDVFGDWVEMVPANTIATTFQLAGFNIQAYPNSASMEIQVGIGAAGLEVAVSNILQIASAGNENIQVHMLPVALNVALANIRISLRIRSDGTHITPQVALLYYPALTASTATDSPYTYAPYGSISGGLPITPNIVAWGNSDWYEMLPSLESGARLIGISPIWSTDYMGIDYEIDLGIGALGMESVVTTLRGNFPPVGSQGLHNLYLPALYTLSGAQRVSVRMRKAGTASNDLKLFLLYFPADDVSPSADSIGCSAIVGQISVFGSGLDLLSPSDISVTINGVVFETSIISATNTTMIVEITDYVDGVVCITVGSNSPVCSGLHCAVPQASADLWRLHRFDLKPTWNQSA